MEVFKTKDKGWGLRSLDPIRAGAFICEYAGEVIDKARLSQLIREGDTAEYVFDTTRVYESFKWNYEPKLLDEVRANESSEDYAMPHPLIINAKNVGNVARFMNHSCSPNVFWQPVLYEENNQSFLHVAFFALRHIPPMQELTYDYGADRSDNAEGSSAHKDVFGVLHQVVRSQIGGSGKKACINVTLSDDCGAELDVTLWESYANQHTSYIKDNAPPATRKLNVSNAWNGSKLLLNYDHPQVTAFKSNFEDGKPYSISSQTMSVNFASQTAFEERSFSFVKDMKTIGQIMSLKDDTFCNTIGMTKRFKSNRFV
ncbi:hypothetical protein KIW84_044494 [Lathyrus oleraceus]|uniref:SET domain-containing protein n=1 Tax=Pisum sativum TaxID=3888 RepID=A0A9D4XGA0_PEA|nr:hypothetical protein KIW84_044494 [Pisum sativum]